jgi:tRNA(fMet)-specific endonuclease VapC
VVAILRGNVAIEEQIFRISRPVLASFAFAELLFGAQRSDDPSRHSQAVTRFASRCFIAYPDRATLDAYVEAKLDLFRQGKPIPENDLWIAAICLRYDLTLAFRDSHFDHVSRLKKFRY